MYDAIEIATKINSVLKVKQLSQKEMLKKCNLNKNAISTMLSRGAMPRADNLAQIADYLDCSMDYLMGRDNHSQQFSPLIYELMSKYTALPKDSQDEIVHILNYKYDQQQLKRKETSSHLEPKILNNVESNKLA